MIDVVLHCGDCLDWLPTLPDASVDCVITDPPYPEIDRDYGRLTEREWWALVVDGVIPQVRRILKPRGSAVFILQPNSRKVGSMRGWLWEFMAWCCREWNMVQDAWWWNVCAVPEAHSIQGRLMRPSVKACVWCGPVDCYRDQSACLWEVSQETVALSARARAGRFAQPSGHGVDRLRSASAHEQRGGVLPFNMLPFGNSKLAGIAGHPAATPSGLADWWTRYICPPGGVVCDPFAGSGTMGLAAIRRGRRFVGCEKMPQYHDIARRRLAEVTGERLPPAPVEREWWEGLPLFAGGEAS